MPISQILLISTTSGGGGGGGGGGDGLAPPTTFTPDVDTSGIVTSGWQILMATNGLKSSETLSDPFARIGTTGFREANFQSSGAITRTAFGDGRGVYANFFLKTGITKIALVDGSGTLSDPTSNTNYLIYDLVSSTGSETIYDIIRRLDYYLQTNTPFHTNDTVYGSPAVTDFTAGANGYSGLLTSNGGSGFRDNDGDLPDKFVIMGINRDGDNDIQALCSYSGNLLSGKGDQWRNNNPLETFWSYWGDDFHANSQTQRPGREKQTNPGIGDDVASYTGPVYLLAFSSSIQPTYTLTPDADNVDEGSTLTFNVTGTNIVDGTYYWTMETSAGDFGANNGLVTITGNTGSFTVTPDADTTTEGAETFTVSLRADSIAGTILATSDPVTINDTSLDPEPPFSLQFNQPQGDYLSTPASTDWNLGTSWTIEFWLNANRSGDGSANMTGGIWGLLNQEGWAATNAINIAISDSKLVVGQGAQYDDVRYTEPTPAQWTHVAIVNDAGTQKVFYNGVEQTKVSGTFGTANYTNSTDSLAIGNISGGNNYFDGKMAMVRISNTAKYAAAFTSTVTYGVESDTRLFLDSDTPLVDTSYYELNNVSVVTNNLTTIFISKSAYPNLDKQVRVGNTVTNADDSTTCIVTAPVFTADPDNWGVDVSPGWGGVTTVDFTGARHTIVNNGTTESEEFPIGSMTAYVGGYNIELQRLMPSVSGNPDLTPVVAGWTVTGPLDFTATVVEVSSNSINWLIVVDASLAEFTGFNAGNYTFTPPA